MLLDIVSREFEQAHGIVYHRKQENNEEDHEGKGVDYECTVYERNDEQIVKLEEVCVCLASE